MPHVPAPTYGCFSRAPAGTARGIGSAGGTGGRDADGYERPMTAGNNAAVSTAPPVSVRRPRRAQRGTRWTCRGGTEATPSRGLADQPLLQQVSCGAALLIGHQSIIRSHSAVPAGTRTRLHPGVVWRSPVTSRRSQKVSRRQFPVAAAAGCRRDSRQQSGCLSAVRAAGCMDILPAAPAGRLASLPTFGIFSFPFAWFWRAVMRRAQALRPRDQRRQVGAQVSQTSRAAVQPCSILMTVIKRGTVREARWSAYAQPC